MTNIVFSFGTSLLRAGLPTVLGMLCLSAVAQTPARSAFDILEVGRWSNPPTKTNPLAAHHTYHSAAMNVDVGYTIYLPPSYATNSVRYAVVYWLPGGGCNEEPDSPSIAQGLLGGIDAAIRNGKLPPLIFVIFNGGRYTRYYDSLDGTIMMETTIIKELIPHSDTSYRTVATRAGRAIQGGSMARQPCSPPMPTIFAEGWRLKSSSAARMACWTGARKCTPAW